MEFKTLKIDSLPPVLDGYPIVQDIEKAVKCLKEEKVPIARYEFGYSMMPILRSGQFCKITPFETDDEIEVGDALFCNVNGYVGTHMVLVKSKIDPDNIWYLIASTDGTPLGWTDTVYGKATAMNTIVINNYPGSSRRLQWK